jgi:protein-tyrosine sulfotransferase
VTGVSYSTTRRLDKMEPIFVVTLARSGSTLLRFILDSHSEVVCPPELNFSQLITENVRPWMGLRDEGTAKERERLAVANARRAAISLMRWHVERAGKKRFCDKSLSTVDQLDITSRVFPRSHFVILYRHCLDLVMSGLDASRWGFSAFGFVPYAQANTQNFVTALVEYWCDKTERALDFERRRPEICYRLYYEMLVKEPEETMMGVLDFLKVGWEDGLLERAFERSHQPGPGDYEVEFTENVADQSLGGGSSIPVNLIPPQQRYRMNMVLRQLGYPIVDDRWNDSPSPLLSVAQPLAGAPRSEATRLMEELAAPRVARLARSLEPKKRVSLRIVVEQSPSFESWVIDLWRGEVFRGEAATSIEVVLSSGVLGDIATNHWSAGEALSSGRLRVTRASEPSDLTNKRVVSLMRALFGPDEVTSLE